MENMNDCHWWKFSLQHQQVPRFPAQAKNWDWISEEIVNDNSAFGIAIVLVMRTTTLYSSSSSVRQWNQALFWRVPVIFFLVELDVHNILFFNEFL